MFLTEVIDKKAYRLSCFGGILRVNVFVGKTLMRCNLWMSSKQLVCDIIKIDYLLQQQNI